MGTRTLFVVFHALLLGISVALGGITLSLGQWGLSILAVMSAALCFQNLRAAINGRDC